MRLATQRRPRMMSDHIPKDREADLPYDFNMQDWHYALDYWDDRCAICGRGRAEGLTIARDHWIPLSNKRRCPGTIPSNIIPLCHGLGGCNNLKSNKNPVQWAKGHLGIYADERLSAIDAFFETVRKTRYDR